MTRTPLRSLAMTVAVLALSAIPSAHSDQLTAELVASEVLVADGVADVTFKIEVTNGAATAASNVRVRFADGAAVNIGDVAAESKASSEQQRRVIDVSAHPSVNVPIEATLEYSEGDATVEQSVTLVVRVMR